VQPCCGREQGRETTPGVRYAQGAGAGRAEGGGRSPALQEQDRDGRFGTWLLSSSPPLPCLPVAPVTGMGGRADTAAAAPGPLRVGLGRGGSAGARHGVSHTAAMEPALGAAAAHVLPFPPGMADGSPSAQPSCAASPIFSFCVCFPTEGGPSTEEEDGWRGADGRQKTSPAKQSSSQQAHYPVPLLITLLQCEGHRYVAHV